MMKVTRQDLDTAVNRIRENNDMNFQNYSGRGMYARPTWGVVTEAPKVLNEFELELAIVLSTQEYVPGTGDNVDVFELRDHYNQITDERREDSLGYSVIWYYPGIEIIDE